MACTVKISKNVFNFVIFMSIVWYLISNPADINRFQSQTGNIFTSHVFTIEETNVEFHLNKVSKVFKGEAFLFLFRIGPCATDRSYL